MTTQRALVVTTLSVLAALFLVAVAWPNLLIYAWFG